MLTLGTRPTHHSQPRPGQTRVGPHPESGQRRLNQRIAVWIATQQVRPTRTAAIEYLLDLGLKADARKR